MSKDLIKKSKIEPSNPYAAVGLNRENPRKITDSNQQPVKINRETGLTGQQNNEREAADYPALLEEVEATLQQPLSPHLQQQILNLTISRVRDALDSYREAQRQSTPIRKPAAWFVAALQRRYKPNGRGKPQQGGSMEVAQAIHQPQEVTPPAGFGDWFALAQRAGIAKRSGYRAGEFCIETREGWEPWLEVEQTWPLAKLQELVTAELGIQPGTQPASRTVDEPVVEQEPKVAEQWDPVQRADVLARLKAKVQLPWLKNEAILLAKTWGFEVTEAGIFEGASCG